MRHQRRDLRVEIGQEFNSGQRAGVDDRSVPMREQRPSERVRSSSEPFRRFKSGRGWPRPFMWRKHRSREGVGKVPLASEVPVQRRRLDAEFLCEPPSGEPFMADLRQQDEGDRDYPFACERRAARGRHCTTAADRTWDSPSHGVIDESMKNIMN